MNPSDYEKHAKLRLRAAAERQIDNEALTGEDPVHPDEKLLHELQVHQVDREMQNETMRQKQIGLEAMRDRYVDLYDFAPVGYLTLDSNRLLEEINLTAVKLLGIAPKDVLHRHFTSLTPEDLDRCKEFLLDVTDHDEKRHIELALQRRDDTVFQVQLDCLRTKVGADETAIRIVLTDISLRKSTQAAQLQRIEELERFNCAAVDRNLAMIELKQQENVLSRELGRASPFALNFDGAPGAGDSGPPSPATGAPQ